MEMIQQYGARGGQHVLCRLLAVFNLDVGDFTASL